MNTLILLFLVNLSSLLGVGPVAPVFNESMPEIEFDADEKNTLSLKKENILHEFHLSKCEVVYSEEDHALQITLHIFIDDLELALEQQGNKGLYIATEREHESADSILYMYLQEEFQLTADDQLLQYNYIGKEPSSDLLAVWCYLEVENFKPNKSLTVSNHILLDVYDDQKNIVSVKMPGKKGGYYMMEKDNYEQTFQLQ